jgi:hypothetical protein
VMPLPTQGALLRPGERERILENDFHGLRHLAASGGA